MSEGETHQLHEKIDREIIERKNNIVTIRKPEGIYSIAYALHTQEEQVKIPEDVESICFESQGEYPKRSNELRDFVVMVGNQTPILAFAERNNRDLIANDCSIHPLMPPAEAMLEVAELVAGCTLYSKIRSETTKTEELAETNEVKPKTGKMNRRQFLAGAAAASYFLLPSASTFSRIGSAVTGIGEKQTAALQKITQKLHPEWKIIVQTLRDVVSAQKMHFLLMSLNRSRYILDF